MGRDRGRPRCPSSSTADPAPHPGEHTGPGPIWALLARHPRLRLIVAHMGMPEYTDFLDLCERYDEVHLDTTMAFTPFVEETMPFPVDAYPRLRDLGDRILFGSDFPNIPYGYDAALTAVTRLDGFDDDWLRGVLHDNGARLFGLDRLRRLRELTWRVTSVDPFDPPIPVPDVEGADASSRGLPEPRRSELATEAHRRLVGHGRPRTPHGHRVGRSAPRCCRAWRRRHCVRRRSRAEREALEFYAELGAARIPSRRFPRPPSCRGCRRVRRTRSPSGWRADGCENIRFTSSIEAINPLCGSSAAATRATTSCTPSTGATMTGRIPRCA